MADILGNRKIQALDEQRKAEAEILRLQEEQNRLDKDNSVLIAAQEKKLRAIGKEIKKINQDKLDGLKSAEKSVSSISGIYGNLNKLERERIKNTFISGKLSDEQVGALNKMADINRDIAQLSIDDVAGRGALLQEYDDISKSLGTISEEDKKILENLTEQNKMALAHANMTKTQKDFLEKQVKVYDGIKDSIVGILETASLLTSNLKGAMGAAVIGVGFGLEKWGKSVRSFGGYVDSAQISSVALGFAFKDAEEVTKGLSKEFGGLKDVSFSTQLNTNLMATNMGISGAEAANVVGNFARMNDGSASTAMDMAATTKALGKAAGVPIDSLMKDVAGSTKAFAEYGKNGGLNMTIAAVAAAKMGVSMDSMTKVSDSLLDFETSINGEMELGAMLGKQLNLDRARGLAYEGNMTGAVKETLNQLGGIEAFNKMDIFQKRKAAELLGLSVDEFQKMAAKSDEISENGEASVSKWSTFWEGTTAFVTGPLAGMLKTFGSSLIAMGQMSPMLKDMGINMGGMAKQAFEWVKNLIKGKALESAVGATGGIAETATASIQEKATDAVKDKLGGIAEDKLGSIAEDKLGGIAEDKLGSIEIPKTETGGDVNKKGGLMESMGKIKMSDVLKGAAAMLIVAAAVFVFAKAVQEFMKVSWESIGMAVVSMLALVGAVALLGAIMSSGVGAIAILAGAAAMLIVAASVLVLGIALQAIGTGFQMLGAGITTLVPNLTAVGTAISSMITFIPAIAALSLAMLGLAASLTAVGIAGIFALPGLLAISAVGAVAVGIGSLLGIGGDEGGGGKTDSTAELISEIKGLRADLNAGKISVHMDGQKVTSKISAVVAKGSTNSYAKQ